MSCFINAIYCIEIRIVELESFCAFGVHAPPLFAEGFYQIGESRQIPPKEGSKPNDGTYLQKCK